MLSVRYLGLALILSVTNGVALADDADRPPKYIEYATLIINIVENGAAGTSGYVLATSCSECAPARIEVNGETRLYLNGRPAQLSDLGLKIDWEGSLFYRESTPPVATELFLN